jgi:hypothetical protein
MKNAQPTLRKPVRRSPGGGDLDPSKLGATLRELALRAHQLVRAADGTDSIPGETERQLEEVHERIVQLQRSLGSHRPGELATYVAALRERVEERLA